MPGTPTPTPRPPSPTSTTIVPTTTPSSKTITLQTPHLLLRAALPTDAEALHAVFSDPEVMRYWSTLPHTTLAQTAAWLGKMVAGPQNGVTEFVICLCPPASASATSAPAPNSRLVGEAGPGPAPAPTSPSDRPSDAAIGKIGIWRATEIGFLLHRSHWRRGLMREAVDALLPYYFAPVEDGGRGLEVVTADTDPRNRASLAFLTGCGFEVTGREERTARVGVYGAETEGGEWVDSVFLALRREVWAERVREREGKREEDGGRVEYGI